MTEVARGAYGILLTTYDEDDRVSHRDLTAQAEFVAGTCQGLVWPVLASEWYLMDADEIAAGYPAVAAGVGGRVPFVAGVTQLTTAGAVGLAQAAARAGADAVIAMPPFLRKATGDDLVRHFQAIAAVGLPVVVQNAASMGAAGTLTAAELRTLAESIPLVRHLKEEAPVLPQTISRALTALPGLYERVFGGGGGRYLIDELNRGGAGTMAACEWVDVLGSVFRLYDEGRMDDARRLHTRALAGIVLETAYGMAGAREVLRRRGVIHSTRTRFGAGAELDADAHREIEAVLAHMPLEAVR